MSFKRKVLWVDDEHLNNRLKSSIKKFQKNDIIVATAQNAKEAKRKLDENHLSYDALVIDRSFNIDNPNKIPDEMDESGFSTLYHFLNENKNIYGAKPFFIYSGRSKVEIMQQEWIMKNISEEKIFNKNTPESFLKLVEAIKNVNTVELNIKIKYDSFFEILEKRGFKEETKSVFLNLLKLNYDVTNIIGLDQGYGNKLRQVLEEVLFIYKSYNVLPDKCFSNYNDEEKVKFSESLNFLKGNEHITKDFKLKPLNKPLSSSFNNYYYVWNNTSSDSHFDESKKLDLNEFKVNKLLSIANSLVDIIFEMDFFLKGNVDNVDGYINWQVLKNNSKEINEKTIICQDSNKNYYCEVNGKKLLLLYLQINGIHKIGTEILVSKIDENTNDRTNSLYETRVIDFKPI